MELEHHKLQSNLYLQLGNLNRITEPSFLQYPQEWKPYTWVQLLKLPSPLCFDEALLLCEHSENQWHTWIPDYGLTVMHVSQFGKTQMSS